MAHSKGVAKGQGLPPTVPVERCGQRVSAHATRPGRVLSGGRSESGRGHSQPVRPRPPAVTQAFCHDARSECHGRAGTGRWGTQSGSGLFSHHQPSRSPRASASDGRKPQTSQLLRDTGHVPQSTGGRGSRAGTVLSPRRRCRSTTELVTAAPPPAPTRAHSRGPLPRLTGPVGKAARCLLPRTPVPLLRIPREDTAHSGHTSARRRGPSRCRAARPPALHVPPRASSHTSHGAQMPPEQPRPACMPPAGSSLRV